MKSNPWHIQIQADTLLYWYSKLTGTKGNAKAAAFYPILFTTSKIHPKMRPYFINHEIIHFTQQRELWILGAWAYMLYEWLYLRLVKGRSAWDTYLLRSTEQEAYDNMFDLEYLGKREKFAYKKYWSNKPVVWKDYLKKMLQIEEFPIVYEHTDAPGTIYPEHFHKGKVSFFVTYGSVTFSGGIKKTIKTGERFDVPVGVHHSALVGPDGCDYIVGQEIERDA